MLMIEEIEQYLQVSGLSLDFKLHTDSTCKNKR